MELLSSNLARGYQVDVQRNDPRHFDVSGRTGSLEQPKLGGFQDQMLRALEGVNNDEIKATDLYQRMVTDPGSVDAHDVTIAGAQAQMSLSLAKNVIERALQAYRDIVNMR